MPLSEKSRQKVLLASFLEMGLAASSAGRQAHLKLCEERSEEQPRRNARK